MNGPQEIDDTAVELRTLDPDRYLSALFAPGDTRPALMALYAFNLELSRIPGLVSEPALGEIRLQWWRDIIDQMDDSFTCGAPVADALSRAISRHDLRKALLVGMIDARSADLDGGGFDDLQALKAYLYKSEGAVFALAAQILGAAGDIPSGMANDAGLAYGLVKLMRATPRDCAQGRVMVPLALLREHGLTVETLLAGGGDEKMHRVLDDLSGVVREALGRTRGHVTGIDRHAIPAFAPLALVESYLSVLARRGHRPLHDIAEINPLVRFVRLWRAARMARI